MLIEYWEPGSLPDVFLQTHRNIYQTWEETETCGKWQEKKSPYLLPWFLLEKMKYILLTNS